MIPRVAMPQVEEEDYPSFFTYCRSRGVGFAHGLLLPRDHTRLKAHQEPDVFIVTRFPRKALAKPAILAADWTIIDGHHRAQAHIRLRTALPYVRLSLPFHAALRLVRAFPSTHYSEKYRHDIL